MFCTGNQRSAGGRCHSEAKQGKSWKHGGIPAAAAVQMVFPAPARSSAEGRERVSSGGPGCDQAPADGLHGAGPGPGPAGTPRSREKSRPRREGRPVLTVHSAASGSFTCSGRRALSPRPPPPGPGRAPREGTSGHREGSGPALTCTAAASPKKAAINRLQIRHSSPAMAGAAAGAGQGRGGGSSRGPARRARARPPLPGNGVGAAGSAAVWGTVSLAWS